jgi:hypothetical protein
MLALHTLSLSLSHTHTTSLSGPSALELLEASEERCQVLRRELSEAGQMKAALSSELDGLRGEHAAATCRCV